MYEFVLFQSCILQSDCYFEKWLSAFKCSTSLREGNIKQIIDTFCRPVAVTIKVWKIYHTSLFSNQSIEPSIPSVCACV